MRCLLLSCLLICTPISHAYDLAAVMKHEAEPLLKELDRVEEEIALHKKELEHLEEKRKELEEKLYAKGMLHPCGKYLCGSWKRPQKEA